MIELTWISQALIVLAAGLMLGSDQWYVIALSMVVGAGAAAHLAIGKPVRSQISTLVIQLGIAGVFWVLRAPTMALYFALAGLASMGAAFVSERLAWRRSQS